MAESVGKNMTRRTKTGKFVPQGQTAGPYGQDPGVTAKGVAAKPARPIETR